MTFKTFFLTWPYDVRLDLSKVFLIALLISFKDKYLDIVYCILYIVWYRYLVEYK